MGLTSRIGALLLLGIVLAAATWTHAQGQSASSEQVQAAFLLNFAQYIEWPDGSFENSDAPIVVGVLGDDPFGSILDETFAEASAQGRRLVIHRGRHVDDMRNCHMLFVSRSERDRQSEILASLKDRSVVTVGDSEGFARRGGILNFYLEGKKVRFEINAGAAERKGLKISSQLLKRAGRRF